MGSMRGAINAEMRRTPCAQVDETVGFQEGEGEDPMEDPMAVAAAEAGAAGDAAAWQAEPSDTDDEVAVRPPEETSFSEVPRLFLPLWRGGIPNRTLLTIGVILKLYIATFSGSSFQFIVMYDVLMLVFADVINF